MNWFRHGVLGFALCCAPALFAGTFRVATYNVENYLDQPTESRPSVKSAAARAKVRESILAVRPDVIALEEMGGPGALRELRESLRADGLDLPFWELVNGVDTNIHIAVLSRFPITARRPHTNETYLLDGRRRQVSRGFADVDIQAATNFTFTLIAAHLKSRRPVPEADESEMRRHEAGILRGIVEAHLKADPDARLVVLGDFNDAKSSDSTRTIIGRGHGRLIDTRPAELNGDDAPGPAGRHEPRNVNWTHFYGVEDSYSRVDYILLSPAMAKVWLRDKTYIPKIPNWGVGSDHRPIVASFQAGEN